MSVCATRSQIYYIVYFRQFIYPTFLVFKFFLPSYIFQVALDNIQHSHIFYLMIVLSESSTYSAKLVLRYKHNFEVILASLIGPASKLSTNKLPFQN